MFKRWFRRSPMPLSSAPAVRRQKTYSAQSGYVYQYFYEGHCPLRRAGETGTEYVFEVSAGPKISLRVSVLVSDEALAVWEGRHGRGMAANERYAVAKMALFQAFDERPQPADLRHEIRVRAVDVEGILSTLGLD